MIGYELFNAAGSRWRKLHGAAVPYELPHVETPLSEAEARTLLRQSGCLLVRWNEGFDLPHPTSWWHIVKDGDPDLARLSKKVRYQVRQGLKYFSVRQCDRSFISESAYDVYVAAFARYETFEPVYAKARFQSAITEAPPEVEFWGVFDAETGQLCAFADNVVDHGACFYSTMWFTPEALKRFAAYALVQAMNEEYLGRRGLSYVSDGARNISHQTNVHQFLQDKFGFRKAYSRLAVAYAPSVALLVRCLFPFRKAVIARGPFARLRVLLDQEQLRRSCWPGVAR